MYTTGFMDSLFRRDVGLCAPLVFTKSDDPSWIEQDPSPRILTEHRAFSSSEPLRKGRSYPAKNLQLTF